MKKSHSSLPARQLIQNSWRKLFLAVTVLVNYSVSAQSIASESNAQSDPGRTSVHVQDTSTRSLETLNAGEPRSRQIRGGESQFFSISLATGQYAEISIEQHGSLLLAKLFDPLGTEVIQMDYPGGGFGPIYLAHIALLSGEFRLEIRSINKWAKTAHYDVALTALRSAEVVDEALVEAQLALSKGQRSLAEGQSAAAIKHYNQALGYWKASRRLHRQAVTQYALSQAYRGLSNRPKQEEYLNETLKTLNIQMAPNDWRLKASALNDLGPIFAAAGENEKAQRVLNEALNLYAANRDGRGQASALSNLAGIHLRTGDFALARELVEKALNLRRAENDKPGVAGLLNGLGAISDRLGEPDQALNYFTQALHAWEELGELSSADRLRVAELFNNLAFVSDKLGKSDQALDYYDKSLAIYTKDDVRRVPTLDNKGELYAALGHPLTARESYEEALRLLESTGKPDLDIKAGLLVHVGQLSVAEGDFTTAVKIFEQASAIQPNPPKLADVLTNLGTALALKGDLEKAMEVLQRALDIQIKVSDHRGQSLTLRRRAVAYALSGREDEALNDLNRALVYWKAVKDYREEATTLNAITRLERQRGNLTVALATSREAISLIELLRKNVSRRQLQTAYFATQVNSYEVDVDLKMQLSKKVNRTEYLAAALESNEQARSRALLDTLGETGVGRTAISQTADTKLIGLVEQRFNLMARLESKVQERTKLLSSNNASDQIRIIDSQIVAIREQYDELETQIRSQSPRFASLTKPRISSLSEIQAQLDADTLLVEYALGEKRSYVWVVSPNSIGGFELPARDRIEAMARRVTDALTARNRDEKNESWLQKSARIEKADNEYYGAVASLSDMIITPIASLLGRKRLVVVADGALQLIPFAALSIPRTATASRDTAHSKAANKLGGGIPGALEEDRIPLMTDHEIVGLASASVLALQRRELTTRNPAPLAVAVLADPVYPNDSRARKARLASSGKGSLDHPTQPRPSKSSDVSPGSNDYSSQLTRALRDVGLTEISTLPFSRDEAKAIMKVAPRGEGMAALDFKASRATAMGSELRKYRFIHFATHGVMDLEHPELSGIILSMVDEKGQPQDGYLRLHEIYNLNLPAELVVLSACQTGIGKQIKGEGLIALTRGFMYAGAKSVVASYWKVDDSATAALMAEFYKQMFTNKLKPAAALTEAQRWMSKQKRWQSPYYWAGFFLQGEWN